MPCDNYKEFTVNYCPDGFYVSELAASTEYIWEFKDKFGNKYKGEATTDEDDLLVILVDEETTGLTKDLFQHFSGAWEFRVYTLDDSGVEQAVVFCGLYDFLVITFEKVTPIPDPNIAELTLECPEV